MKNKQEYTGLEIAIIGMACRFPDADNKEEFWENLKNGIESIEELSDEEIEEAGISKKTINKENYIKNTRRIKNSLNFDASFFGFSPKEAEILDPQIRVFHETSWEALEDSGYIPKKYDGLIGVFAVAEDNFFWRSASFFSDKYEMLDRNMADKDFLSTLLSYKFDLRGPSYNINTACSSSLVTVHLACQSLLSGECDIAIAGGVKVSLPEKQGYEYNPQSILSPDGHCRAFDESANGTALGNGAGVVILKSLESAIEDGDNIYAVIKGSATNNDGNRKIGYTAPSIDGQAEVIKLAQSIAEVESETISYLEAHGTGTLIGDPIEVEGLKLAFDTEEKNFCSLGSVKSNIGHLSTAAGMASLIKVVMAMKNKELPPLVNYKKANPLLDLENSPFFINKDLKKWESRNIPRRAGVSSFGIGGTNAHLILEEYETNDFERKIEKDIIFNLSGRSENVLEIMTNNLINHLKLNKEINLLDLAYTLYEGRTEFNFRKSIMANDLEELINKLEDDKVNIAYIDKEPTKVFMFSGQGSQYIKMGYDLYKENDIFKENLDNCFFILKRISKTDFKDIWLLDTDKINQTKYTQVLLFSIEYSLAKLLLEIGISPDYMIGHSIGEYVAACIAEVMNVEDMLELVYLRGKLMNDLPKGSMLSVTLSKDEINKILPIELSIAAVNSSNIIVVTGKDEDIDKFKEKLDQNEILNRKLHTSHAFHSSMMEPILSEFENRVSKIEIKEPKIPYYSNITGELVKYEEIRNSKYWSNHLRNTVNFNDGIDRILDDKNIVFIELGPGNVLSTFVKRNRNKTEEVFAINLIRHVKENRNDNKYFLENISKLWTLGITYDFKKIFSSDIYKRISLPTYPFERKEYSKLVKSGKVLLKIFSEKEIKNLEYSDMNFDDEEQELYERPSLSTKYNKPKNEIQKVLCEIWQKSFEIDQIGITDNFFELGGDSIKATLLITKINKNLNVELSLEDFFSNNNIEDLSLVLEELEKKEYESIPKADKKDYYRLSHNQKRLWILNQLNPESAVNNIISKFDYKEKIDIDIIEKVLKLLIEKHEGLRTGIKKINNEPFQFILNEFKLPFNLIDMSNEFDYEEKIYTLLEQEYNYVFDFEKPPLFKITLIKIKEDYYTFIFNIDHIVSDGTSVEILRQDYFEMYNKLINNEEVKLGKKEVEYKDFSEWQNDYIEDISNKKESLEFWRSFIGDGFNNFRIPIDKSENLNKKMRLTGKTYVSSIDKDLKEGLVELSKETNSSLFNTFFALFNFFLSTYTNEENIVTGIISNGRKKEELFGLIGYFVNVLPVKIKIDYSKDLFDFVSETNSKILGVLSNQYYPLEIIFEELNVKFPKFSIVLNMLSHSNASEEILDDFEPYFESFGESKFDIEIYMIEYKNKILLEWVFNKTLISDERIISISNLFVEFLKELN